MFVFVFVFVFVFCVCVCVCVCLFVCLFACLFVVFLHLLSFVVLLPPLPVIFSLAAQPAEVGEKPESHRISSFQSWCGCSV